MKNFGLVVVGGLLSLGAFAADEGVTLGGYADVGYRAVMQNKVDGVQQKDVNGFLVREGAVYIGKKWGEWEVFGDLQFGNVTEYRSNVNGDFTASSFAVGVSQAYISQMMESGLNWKLGKFDGLYGYYSGRFDSHAHRLTDLGYIQQAYLPRTHTGLMAGYSFSDMLKVNLLVANDEEFGPNSSGVARGSSVGTRHPDFGVTVAADFDTFSANLGALFMTGKATPTPGASSKLGYVVDAVLEGKLKPLNIGVYGVYFKDDEELAKGDFGVGAVVGYDINEKLGLDLRAEYVSMGSDKVSLFSPVTNTWVPVNFDTITNVKSVLIGTLGAQWKFNDNIKAKLDYSASTISSTGGKVDPVYVLNGGVVANF